MRTKRLNARVLLPAAFLVVAIDFVVTPFLRRESFRAQVAVPAIILDALLIFGVAMLVLRLGNDGALPKILHILFVCIMAFSAGCTMARTEAFIRFTSSSGYQAATVYLVFAGLLYYLLRSGIESVIRLANLLFWPFAASLLLLFAANFAQMKPENLLLEPFAPAEILQAAIRMFSLSPAILFLLVDLQGRPEGKRAVLGKFFWALAALAVLLKICEEMVLGEQTIYQTQVLHSLSRLGRISVFKRMDALHVFIWSMVEFAKSALYLCMAQKSICRIRPGIRNPEWGTLFCSAAGLIAALLCPEELRQVLQSAGTAVFMCGLVICARREGNRSRAETKNA